MSYTINPAAFSAVFTVPCDVADKHLKLATASQLKVLIYVMRNLAGGINADNCAEALGLALSEVEDALLFCILYHGFVVGNGAVEIVESILFEYQRFLR